MSKKARLQDVAEVAGVSIATVSRALNDKNSVKTTTYNKIANAVRTVGYDSYSISHNSKIILILLPDMENPFYSGVIKGISESCKRHGYQEVIIATGNDGLTFPTLQDLVNKIHAEGIITLEPILSKDTLEEINAKIPIVQCSEYNEDSDVSYVSIDDVAAAKSVVKHILSKGKKRIVLFNGPLKYKYARKRQEGFIQALEEANINVTPNMIVNIPEFSYDAAISVATQLLLAIEPPEVIFATSDVFATAAITAAQRIGINIPSKLGVVGFDNTYLAVMSNPPLTTVRQPQFQLGFMSGEILFEQISNETATSKHIMLDTELVIRNSL